MLLKQNELNKTGGILVFQSSETKATTTAIAVAIATSTAIAIAIAVAIATATAMVIATATAASIIIKFSRGILLTNMLIYLETVQFRICTVRDNSTLKTSAVEMKNHLWAGMAVTAPTRGGGDLYN